jgi:MSHA biogenesis protein MshL
MRRRRAPIQLHENECALHEPRIRSGGRPACRRGGRLAPRNPFRFKVREHGAFANAALHEPFREPLALDFSAVTPMKHNPRDRAPHSEFVLPLVSLALLLAGSGCETEIAKDRANRGWLVATNQGQATAPPPRMSSPIAPVAVSGYQPPTPPAEVPEKSFAEHAAAARATPPGDGRVYSFSAKDLDIKDALALFARSNELNIVPDPDVTGTVSVEFKNLPIEKSMEAILGAMGYYADASGGLIRVHSQRTEFFTVDYLRLIRTGNGSSSANISSSSGESSGGGTGGSGAGASGGSSGGSGGSGDSTSVSISKSDSLDFWSEVEIQLKDMLSPTGKIAINRVSGTIMVTDQKGSVDRIGTYLKHIKKTLHRQVDLEAQIYELVLNDEFHFGIDWQNVMVKAGEWAMSSGGAPAGIPTSNLIVGNPIGGNTPGQPALSLAITKDETKIVIDALKEMGNLEVVSQPRIRTLNNQAAMIKVGTDKPFFRRTSNVITANGGTQTQSNVEVTSITIGTILALTPQISDDGWITMDISPVITRLVNTAQGPDGSTAPEVDIKQASSLVRIPQGSTVVIGGLIQNERYKTTRKVPILGDIPGLGYAFRGVYDDTRKTELVIFITPTIVP